MLPYISEFIATLLLISAVAFAKSPVLVVAAFAVAITIGSDLNPAVTVYKYVNGKVSKYGALYFIGAQLLAGLCVGLFSKL
jgi:glycerol uptake facilitator-like aquaporin